jgi:hypothetical protein
MKFRIKQTVDLDGSIIYIPQFRKFRLYWDFWKMNFPPCQIAFRDKEDAENFINKQRKAERSLLLSLSDTLKTDHKTSKVLKIL